MSLFRKLGKKDKSETASIHNHSIQNVYSAAESMPDEDQLNEMFDHLMVATILFQDSMGFDDAKKNMMAAMNNDYKWKMIVSNKQYVYEF